MRKLALCGGLLLLPMGAAAHGAVYTHNFGTVTMTGNVATNVPFSMSVPEAVRGYYFTGDWTNISGTQQSTQFRTNLTPVGAAATGDLRHGGLSNTDPFGLILTGPYWDNSGGASTGPGVANRIPGGANGGHDRGFNLDMNGSMNMAFRSLGATGQSQIASAVGHFLTDAIAPMSGSFGPNSPTFHRPLLLDSLAPPGSVFHYSTTSFSLPMGGTYLVGAHTTRADTGANFDGMVLLYEGAFDPSNPLTNLRGLDDLGSATQNPSMLIDLEAGDYTLVLTHWSGTTIPTFDVAYTAYVAGIPEPATASLLVLGAGALLRRRR